MSESGNTLFNPPFSHIYIEKKIRCHPNTASILAFFPKACRIEINHYKDVFCRNRQNYPLQKQAPSLILAEKQTGFLYKGSPVCQDFGNRYFYYTSSVMNCLYDCEYCYLQGMYPSAFPVVFVNLEDVFDALRPTLSQHPVYLCISYDTDLLAFEPLLGYVKKWFSFAAEHPDLMIELRTKSSNWSALSDLTPRPNIILAWTLSSESIQKSYEHKTPSLTQRLICAKKALDKGFKIRLCFDPLIFSRGWEDDFKKMIDQTFSTLSAHGITDVSIGVFRMAQNYLKPMRKQRPDSALIQYPYENDKGVFHYGPSLTQSMIQLACNIVKQYIPEEKIFIWKEAD